MRYTFRITALILALLVSPAAVALAAGFPGTEEATIAGFITGKVTDDSGAPVAGALAEAFSCVDDARVGSATAGKTGDYRIGPLAAGCYHLRFDGDGHESTWYGDPGIREGAADVDVSGGLVNGIDGSLSVAGATITGTVKGPDGKLLAGAWVTAMRQDETGYSISDARTDPKGKYAVRVSPGSYVIIFAGRGYVTKVHGTPEEPKMVAAAAGKKVAGIDAALAKGGRITGNVTDAAGNPLSNIFAVAYGTGQGVRLAARTDDSGKFVLDGVPTGSYRVAFADREKKYVPQWHGGTTNPQEALPVAVTAPGTVSGIRGVLKPAGGISGRITGPDGNAVPGAVVIARSADNPGSGGSDVSDETGAYTIAGLASGAYIVAVNGSRDAYLPLFYRDAASESSALPVEVLAPQITYGIDQIIHGASLAGTIRDAAGDPVAGVMIGVYRPGKDNSEIVGISSTDSAGTFSLSLPDGEYVLNFTAISGGYLSQWSGGGATQKEAAPVAVARKEGVQKLEIVLAMGGSISGTVRTRTGTAIPGVTVSARDAVSGDSVESAKSDEGGRYVIQGLRAGSYRLIAEGSAVGYIREKLPQQVEVRPAAATEKVDLVLTAGGAASGKVADRSGSPLEGVTVTAYDPATWDDVATATTDGTGAYAIQGLPEGIYRIRFEGRDSRYAVQWYQGKSRREDSAPVEVAGTKTVTGIDAVLSAGVPLTGMVTAAGLPLYDAEVEIYGRTEDEPFDKVRTDRTGTFTVPSLAAGSYRIRFSHSDHVPRWYGGSDRRTAAPVAVEPGMAPVAVSLVKGGGRFSGKLTNPEGQQIGQAWITAIDPATGAAVADERICECSGQFNTPVPAASYLLKVERHGFVTWFGGSSREEAVQVPVFGDVGGLDMVIEEEKVRSGRGAVTTGGPK